MLGFKIWLLRGKLRRWERYLKQVEVDAVHTRADALVASRRHYVGTPTEAKEKAKADAAWTRYTRCLDTRERVELRCQQLKKDLRALEQIQRTPMENFAVNDTRRTFEIWAARERPLMDWQPMRKRQWYYAEQKEACYYLTPAPVQNTWQVIRMIDRQSKLVCTNVTMEYAMAQARKDYETLRHT